MTSDVSCVDVFFSFLTGVIRNASACLSKFGVFIRNWSACFEKASFLYGGSYCTLLLPNIFHSLSKNEAIH